MADSQRCLDCGSLAPSEPWAEGICPRCLLELALAQSPAESEATVTYLTTSKLERGETLAGRYHLRALLGRGGMGEVWRAYDLKLRVDVALKAVRSELLDDQRVLATLRQEVRAARRVVSPNVCRVFDLEEIEERELVSMEYVDGTSLQEILAARSPLELQEAREIASQMLAGLEAIHQAGLVHRDMKPSNVMITRAGRAVVMDFGLAKGLAGAGTGTVAGTPAYMAPEQQRGEAIDARADVFSAGVVLAEMIAPGGVRDSSARQELWRALRAEPPRLPDSPWQAVLARAVAARAEARFESAARLARALEEVTLRVAAAEDLRPYPGLASFTEEDAEYFFGREHEVEAMWRKLRRLHLAALIGPSGAGKSSFLRAGLLAHRPPGWSHLICTPGQAPVAALRQALVPEIAGDTEAMRELVREEPMEAIAAAAARWRQKQKQALVIVDQFEELFTLNPPEVQAGFAELLGRLALEADVHVLLSMRDDFLFLCHGHEALRPILADLTLLGPPVGAALRRAVVQPAMKCGYRFEDEELADEMVAEVGEERGALPLVAFATARLWERRDREAGLLTREAYESIGGVAGALAQHAEATLESIGTDRIPVVRELFRNLVTAEGTRAVREQDELLSVFDRSARDTAEEVLRELIDARLLTSYEVRGEDEEPTRRVEIIHESLLANWPRLVRWQTQDAEGAQLRDELRQAARSWDERGRHDDRLWTGTAFREYRLWRERYPGGLTDVEEAFGSAMTRLATRRRRRRRLAAAAVFALLATGLAVVGAFWRRSVRETRRAEAQKLIVLAQLQLEDYPTAALAYATRSLELADSEEARLLALRALWQGPTAFVVNEIGGRIRFSPAGSWLVQGHSGVSSQTIVSRDGTQRTMDQPTESRRSPCRPVFGAAEDIFAAPCWWLDSGLITLWSASDGRLLASTRPLLRLARPEESGRGHFDCCAVVGGDEEGSRAVVAMGQEDVVTVYALTGDGNHHALGELRAARSLWTGPGQGAYCLDRASGAWLAVVDGSDVSVLTVGNEGLTDRRLLGRHEGDGRRCMADPLGRFFLTFGGSGEIMRWDPSGDSAPEVLKIPSDLGPFRLSDDGRFLIVWPALDDPESDVSIWSIDESPPVLLRRVTLAPTTARPVLGDLDPVGLRYAIRSPNPAHSLWSLAAPAGAEPILLRHGPVGSGGTPDFSPDGRWLATSDGSGLTLWTLARPYPAVMKMEDLEPWSSGLAFGPEGRFLATSVGLEVRVWPLTGPVPPAGHVVFEAEGLKIWNVAVSPDGELFGAGISEGYAVWLGREGEEPIQLPINPPDAPISGESTQSAVSVTFSPDGRFVAALVGLNDLTRAAFRVWEAATGEEVAELRPEGEEARFLSSFASDGRLLTASTRGVTAWDVETGEQEVLLEAPVLWAVASRDGRRLLLVEEGEGGLRQGAAGSPIFFDLDSGVVTTLTTHGSDVLATALDPQGTVVVTADSHGVIRVGAVTGEEPHLLLGHEGMILELAVDPLGRWIASAAMDKTVRLWPMPDLSQPPLHTLPRGELIAKLETLTNLRAVPDAESSTGWKLTHEPFAGWETAPAW